MYIVFAQQLPLARTLYNLAVLLLKERPVRILYVSVDLPRRKHLPPYLSMSVIEHTRNRYAGNFNQNEILRATECLEQASRLFPQSARSACPCLLVPLPLSRAPGMH